MEQYWFFLAGLISGFIILIFIKKKSYFHINNQIYLSLNPFEIITISINVLLAIYVTTILARRNDQEKLSKEFLINSFDQYNKDVRNTILKFIDNEEFDTINVRAKFKTLRIRLTSLLKIAIENGLLIVDSSSPSVSTKMTELWEIGRASCRER